MPAGCLPNVHKIRRSVTLIIAASAGTTLLIAFLTLSDKLRWPANCPTSCADAPLDITAIASQATSLRRPHVNPWPFNDSSKMFIFDPAAAGVVRITHQSWKTSDLPPRFRRWSLSFTTCHPQWQRHLWTDKDNEMLVVKHFPWFLPTYQKLMNPVQKADASRLLYMYKYGGVYCDLDCECLRPFEHLLVNVSLAFGAMKGHTTGKEDDRYVEEGQIENSFMYSVPEHPFIMRLIKRLMANPFGNPEDVTGPYLIMREIHQTRKSKGGFPKEFRGMKYLEIFPPAYFNPFSWLGNKVAACKDKGDFSRGDEEACKAAHRNSSYVLQYHTQVWLAGSLHLNKD